MTYSPAISAMPPPMVSVLPPWGYAASVSTVDSAAAFASGTYESASRAAYFPVSVRSTCVVRRLWWANGATVSASYNIDVGIYRDAGNKPGAKIVSAGSTAQGTASQVQFVEVTDTTLAPGLYWIAIVSDSSSATIFRILSSAAIDATVKFVEASAAPLPATATPAESTASSTTYLFGFATTASP